MKVNCIANSMHPTALRYYPDFRADYLQNRRDVRSINARQSLPKSGTPTFLSPFHRARRRLTVVSFTSKHSKKTWEQILLKIACILVVTANVIVHTMLESFTKVATAEKVVLKNSVEQLPEDYADYNYPSLPKCTREVITMRIKESYVLAGYQPVWGEEFNVSKLNPQKWMLRKNMGGEPTWRCHVSGGDATISSLASLDTHLCDEPIFSKAAFPFRAILS